MKTVLRRVLSLALLLATVSLPFLPPELGTRNPLRLPLIVYGGVWFLFMLAAAFIVKWNWTTAALQQPETLPTASIQPKKDFS
jgi:hypothetical protein